jgi:predicted nucleic acid-binding protein
LYLLDTNVISELRRRHRAQRSVSQWVAGLEPALLHISVVTVLEIELGALLVARRDVITGTVLRRWIDSLLLPAFAGRILPVDTSVALRCAILHVPNPRPERDALIAATALVHGLTLVTRDTADFQHAGLRLLNPWL